MSRSAVWTPSRRTPDIELYDRGCDLVEAATAIRRGVADSDASPAFPALLGCLEAALRELGDAAAALQQASGEPRPTPADPKAQAVADRLHRGYTNLRVAVRDAEAASRRPACSPPAQSRTVVTHGLGRRVASARAPGPRTWCAVGPCPRRGLRRCARAEYALQRERVALSPQEPAQHRREGLRVDRHACAGGDRLGSRIGLLAGDPALLDFEVRRIAGAIHARCLGHAAVRVNRQEPSGVMRQALNSGPDELGHGHDAVDLEKRKAGAGRAR